MIGQSIFCLIFMAHHECYASALLFLNSSEHIVAPQ